MTCCFRAPKEDEDSEHVLLQEFEAIKESLSTGAFPGKKSLTSISYVRYLERQNEYLHAVYFKRSTEIARLQSYISQLVKAAPGQRNKLIRDFKHQPFKEIGSLSHRYSMFPTLEQHNAAMGDIKTRQELVMQRLRKQIGSFEKASKNLPKECWMSKEQGNDSKLSLTNEKAASNQIICRTLATETTNNDSTDIISSMNVSNESCNTLRESVISARSSSFKELRELYQNHILKC